MFGSFPHESVPDGTVLAPHHFYIGVLLALLVCWAVSDADSDAGPWGVAGVSVFAVFAFALTWPYYPAVGALGVLVLLGAATASALVRPFWWRSGVPVRGGLLAGLAIAWDDALSHALGWRTPLDVLWGEYLYPYVSNPHLPTINQLLADFEAFLAEHVPDALAVVAL